jgi:acyl-CoA synthetase (AMP-forming)/AMP-acid ligase II
MSIDFLLDIFWANQDKEAVVWQDQIFPYAWLLDALQHWRSVLKDNAVAPGSVVSLESDFSPNSIALLLALIEHRCIIVPLTTSVEAKKPEFRDIAEVEVVIAVDAADQISIQHRPDTAFHGMLQQLKQRQHPGLVLFSSGSTGKSKAAVHDLVPLLEKFKVPRKFLRTISFLLFDHIGGINTLLYSLSNAGCIVTLQERLPDTVCAAIEKYQVQLLPTSPTFINLLLISEAYKRYDLSSLTLVTYGTEVMPETTLQRFNALFPQVRLLQTYGLSEIGIMRSQSKSSDSLWVRVGGEGFEIRIVDGLLEVKAQSAMMGYLNAPNPFTEDGWFQTGDAVEVDGDYIRILGRKSELINVGGEKVYPAEVESVLQTLEGVEDVAVNAEPNPITGQMVKARIKLSTDETVADFRKRMWVFCQDKLPKYKIPQKIVLVTDSFHSDRFKKMRRE